MPGLQAAIWLEGGLLKLCCLPGSLFLLAVCVPMCAVGDGRQCCYIKLSCAFGPCSRLRNSLCRGPGAKKSLASWENWLVARGALPGQQGREQSSQRLEKPLVVLHGALTLGVGAVSRGLTWSDLLFFFLKLTGCCVSHRLEQARENKETCWEVAVTILAGAGGALGWGAGWCWVVVPVEERARRGC